MLGQAVLAQEQAPAQPAAEAAQPAPEPARTRDIEEIIVTATKREANIQDIPIAVSAFQGDELEARRIDEIEDLAQISPSIHVNTSNTASGGGTLRIRGVGTTGNNIGLEAAVGIFIDGVYRSRSGQGFSDLLDIERVEVLRGPQGTLFGKNTSAGAVSVITKKPNLSESEGYAIGEYGSFDHKRVAGSFSAPIIDEVLGFRFAAGWNDREGYYEDTHSGDAWAERDRYTLRPQLLWVPTDSLEFRLIGEYAERDESCCPAQFAVAGATRPAVAALATAIGLGRDVPTASSVLVSSDSREVGVNHAPFEKITEWGISLEANWDLDWATVTSLTAYRDFKSRYAQDIDFSSADILNPQNPDSGGARDSFKNWSQELRAAGSWEDLDWLIGFYGYTEDLATFTRVELGTQGGAFVDLIFPHFPTAPGGPIPAGAYTPLFPEGAGYQRDARIETGGWAIFTNNTYHAFDRLDLTLGLRFSKETKDAISIVNDAAPGTLLNDPTPSTGTLPWCEQLSVTPTGLAAPFPTTFGFARAALPTLCDNFSFENGATETEWTWTFSAAYRITEDINVYASYSRGYKAGGFNTDQDAVDLVAGSKVDNSRFEPEFADSYEIGVKGTYLDGRARINIAGFVSKFEDFQLNTFTGLGFIVENVALVESRGGEVEAFLSPIEGMTVTFGVTYADTRYADHIGLCFPFQDTIGQTNRCAPFADTPPGGFAEDFIIDGNRITNAPAWTGSASMYYEHALPVATEWTGFVSLNTAYRGRHNTGSNLHPLKFEGAHWFLNSVLGVRSPDGDWELSLWGTNLTNTLDRSIVFDTVFQGGSFSAFLNPPRMWGGALRYNF